METGSEPSDPDFRGAVERVEGRGLSVESVLSVATEVIGSRLGALAGRAYLVDRGSALVPFGGWTWLAERSRRVGIGLASEPEHGIGKGRGLLGRAWLSRRPVWASVPPEESGQEAQQQVRVAVPLPGIGEVAAVLELVLPDAAPPDDLAVEGVEATARVLGEAVLRLRAEASAHRNRARITSLVDEIGEGVVVTDEGGRIRSWNRKAARLLGRDGEEVPVGAAIHECVVPEVAGSLQRALEAATFGGGEVDVAGSVEVQLPRLTLGGPAVTVSVTSWELEGQRSFVFVLVSSGGGPTLHAREAPELAEQWPEPLLVVSADRTWGGGTILSASPSFCRLTGYREVDLAGRSLTTLMDPKQEDRALEGIRRGFASGEGFLTGFVAKRSSGEPFFLRLEVNPVRDRNGVVAYYSARLPEPARDEAFTDALRRAETDPLTGLANRLFFDKRLRRAMERVRKNSDLHYAVLFLDLDRFKEINDQHGHMVGDRLLRVVARQLEAAVRPGDVVARFGGDEFLVLLDLINGVTEAAAVADRIGERLGGKTETPDGAFGISISIGIAMSDTGYERIDQVLRDADAAMYQAKKSGSTGYRIFDSNLYQSEAMRAEVREALLMSLEREELRLYYQPQVDLASNRVSGLEAFLRWEHPERGTLSAGEFIGQAEEMGLILPIGRWVIREACRQLASWKEQLGEDIPVVLNVNLSVKEVADPDLPRWIEKNLEEFQIPPASLRLEIPESILSRRGQDPHGLLDTLKQIGVRIGIGDFRGDHASIANLRSIPLDVLKLGRNFLKASPAGGRKTELLVDEGAVGPILAFARSMGIEVVAVGVETPVQLQTLQRLACPTAQGYLFSAPLEAAGARELMSEAWGAGFEAGPRLA